MRRGATDARSSEKAGSAEPLPRGRARIVTFRVSEDEFEMLARAWLSSGARSLSGFARDAVFDKVQTMQAPSMSLSGDLNTLARTLGELDAALWSASKKIRHVLGPGAGESGSETTGP